MITLVVVLAVTTPQTPPEDSGASSLQAGHSSCPFYGRLGVRGQTVDWLIETGRCHLARKTLGRFTALQAFREAHLRDPSNPEPIYWIARTGIALGSADGEAIALNAIEDLWRIDPDFRDSWQLWSDLFHSQTNLENTAQILEPFSESKPIALRRAQILIWSGEYQEALDQLNQVRSSSPGDGSVAALVAQVLLETGHADGEQAYLEAVALADTDSLGILWSHAQPIASPLEAEAWEGLTESGRSRYLLSFWNKRDPNVGTRSNERIVEHFQRLQFARRNYYLRHPSSLFHTSPTWRSVLYSPTDEVERSARLLGLTGSLSGLSARSPLVQNSVIATIPTETRYRHLGFDGRGLLYLRHGEPRTKAIDTQAGVETWTYEIDGARRDFTLQQSTMFETERQRAGGYTGGDYVFKPQSGGELAGFAVLLNTDRSEVQQTGEMDSWVASFRGLRDSNLVYVAVDDSAYARLWNGAYDVVGDRGPAERLEFSAGTGLYHIGVDRRSGDRMVGQRGSFVVPQMRQRDSHSVSSLLIAQDTSAIERSDFVLAMPADLRFESSGILSLYLEIYDLRQVSGNLRYTITVEFIQVDGDRRVAFSYERVRQPATTVEETLAVDARQLDHGEFEVVVSVIDENRGASTIRTSRTAVRVN